MQMGAAGWTWMEHICKMIWTNPAILPEIDLGVGCIYNY
jgi:hypothetical protein